MMTTSKEVDEATRQVHATMQACFKVVEDKKLIRLHYIVMSLCNDAMDVDVPDEIITGIDNTIEDIIYGDYFCN